MHILSRKVELLGNGLWVSSSHQVVNALYLVFGERALEKLIQEPAREGTQGSVLCFIREDPAWWEEAALLGIKVNK